MAWPALASAALAILQPHARAEQGLAEQGLIVHNALSLDLTISMAQGSLEKCRSLGDKCAVTVRGAPGRTIIAFEDDGANLHRFR